MKCYAQGSRQLDWRHEIQQYRWKWPCTIDGSWSQVWRKGEEATPVELLLSALGGCAGVAIVRILKARGQNLISFDVDLEGIKKVTEPRMLEKVNAKFYLKGDLDEKVVEKVIDLVMTSISPVAEMLSGPTNLDWGCEITKIAK